MKPTSSSLSVYHACAARPCTSQPATPPAATPATMPSAPPSPVVAQPSKPTSNADASAAITKRDESRRAANPIAMPTSALVPKQVAMHVGVGPSGQSGHCSRPWRMPNTIVGARNTGRPASVPASAPRCQVPPRQPNAASTAARVMTTIHVAWFVRWRPIASSANAAASTSPRPADSVRARSYARRTLANARSERSMFGPPRGAQPAQRAFEPLAIRRRRERRAQPLVITDRGRDDFAIAGRQLLELGERGEDEIVVLVSGHDRGLRRPIRRLVAAVALAPRGPCGPRHLGERPGEGVTLAVELIDLCEPRRHRVLYTILCERLVAEEPRRVTHERCPQHPEKRLDRGTLAVGGSGGEAMALGASEHK